MAIPANVALGATILASVALGQTVNFDNLQTGAPPPGWTATKTGSGAPKWSIEKDDTAPSKPNVLKQSGEATYPVCIKDDTSIKDGFVEVKFKPISGKEDQAGGLIWRAKDSDNYYIARANALEGNVRFYRVVAGSRMQLASAKNYAGTPLLKSLREDPAVVNLAAPPAHPLKFIENGQFGITPPYFPGDCGSLYAGQIHQEILLILARRLNLVRRNQKPAGL